MNLEGTQRQGVFGREVVPLRPIHRIPPEVLHEIFCFATPSLKSFKNAESLLNIGLVCRSWRGEMSAQWAQLRVKVEIHEPIPSTKILAWFANAGDYPKTLNLHPPYFPFDTCACQYSSVQCSWTTVGLPALLLEIPQLEKLVLEFTATSCFRALTGAMKPQATASELGGSSWFSLKSLKLDFCMALSTDGGLSLSEIFDDLPHSLKELNLELWDIAIEKLNGMINFAPSPLRNLTSLSILSTEDLPYIPHILRHCVNLVDLGLDALDTAGSTSVVDQVVLSKVRTLRVGPWSLLHLCKGMDYLHFPSLANLRLDYHGEKVIKEGLPIDSTLGLLRAFSGDGSSSTLRSLTITRCNFASAEALLAMLSALPPSVENIILQWVHFDAGEFLELSGKTENAKKLLPKLEGFEQRMFNSGFDLRSLLQYFKSRRRYSRHAGGIEFYDPPDSLRYVFVSCAETGGHAVWQGCSEIAQELRDEFGVAVNWVVG